MNKWWRPLFFVAMMLPFLGVSAAVANPVNTEQVRVRTVWTDAGLNFAFVVEKDGVNGKHTDFPSLAWVDDAVAVYFDLNPAGSSRLSETCRRVVISAAGGAACQRIVNGEWLDDPAGIKADGKPVFAYAVKVATKKQNDVLVPTGYTVELGIPWGMILPHMPEGNAQTAVPMARFALAVYDFGEAHPVGLWPAELPLENGLLTPSKWGQLAAVQAMGVAKSSANVLNVPFLPVTKDTSWFAVDGDAQGAEWMLAGGVNMSFKVTPTISLKSNAQTQIVAGWYSLEDPRLEFPHVPIEPRCSAATTSEPLYHMEQIISARLVGLDAFAVALPVNSTEREHTRVALRALVEALKGYDLANQSKGQSQLLLLLPILDMSTATNVNFSTPTGQLIAQNTLQDFFALVPSQYRLQIADLHNTPLQPVLVTAPGKGVKWDESLFTAMQLNTRSAGAPLGWLLDKTYQTAGADPRTLTVCSWDPATNFTQGEGAVHAAMVVPGMSGINKDTLSRMGGEIYRNAWAQVNAAQPDFVLLRSWNDYRQGTEVTASTQYSTTSLDITHESIMRQARLSAGEIKLLRTSFPSVIRPGMTVPFDVLLKNDVPRSLGVLYQIFRDGDEVAQGTAANQVTLVTQIPTHLQFSISAKDDKKAPLKPGKYLLKLGFTQNNLNGVVISLFLKTVAVLEIPFTVTDDTIPAQLLSWDCPAIVTIASQPKVSLQLRNLDSRKWGDKERLVLTWLDEKGVLVPGLPPIAVFLKDTLPGAVKDLYFLANAPTLPGTYTLHAELQRDGAAAVPILDTLVQVVTADLNAEIRGVKIPDVVNEADKALNGEVILRNVGKSSWVAGSTQLSWQWLAWDGTPVAGATGSSLLAGATPPDGEITEKISITPPPLGYGQFRCVFGVTVNGIRARLHTSPDKAFSPIYNIIVRKWQYYQFPLAPYFDDTIMAADNDVSPFRANFDGHSNAYPLEEFLPDATNPALGYQPGYRTGKVDITAPEFYFASITGGVRAPVVVAKGQTITWGALNSAALHLAAVTTAPMTGGPAKDYHFIINYADGNVTANLKVSNWLDNPSYGEPVIWKTCHLHTPVGDDWNNYASVFAYQIPLDAKRLVKGITLPNDPDLKIFALTIQKP